MLFVLEDIFLTKPVHQHPGIHAADVRCCKIFFRIRMLVGDDDLAHVIHRIDGCLVRFLAEGIAKSVQHIKGVQGVARADGICQCRAVDG